MNDPTAKIQAAGATTLRGGEWSAVQVQRILARADGSRKTPSCTRTSPQTQAATVAA